MAEDQRAVFVSNISPVATEKTVSDFFSFCGRITRLSLNRSAAGDVQEAVVFFETDSAAKTALLLTNALIVDRPITVVPHAGETVVFGDAAIPIETTPEVQADITQRAYTAPDSERSKTSVIASMLAAGYVLGSDAAVKAREVDEKHMISLQLKVGAESIKAKANEIDNRLHITETATTIKNVAVQKAREVDESFGITEKASVAAAVAKGAAGAVADRVSSNETFAKGFSAIKSVTSSVATAVSGQYQEVKEETKRAIDEKKAERADAANPVASAPAVVPVVVPVAVPVEVPASAPAPEAVLQ